MKINRRGFLVASAAVAGTATCGSRRVRSIEPEARVINLRVDAVDSPLGLENTEPRFSWQMQSDRRNARQSAYRILVASSEAVLSRSEGDLWDTGKVASRKSFDIRYAGKALQSRQQCWWSVQVWDKRGRVCSSEPSQWEMGLLDSSDWSAQWLSVETACGRADRHAGLHWIWGSDSSESRKKGFRFRFRLPEPARKGTLYVVANDWPVWSQITRIWVNGRPVSGTGKWEADIDRSGVTESSHFHIDLGALAAGDHVVAVLMEITAKFWGKSRDLDVSHFRLTPAFAGLMRFNLETGEVMRMTTGPAWRCKSVQDDENWASPRFDDQKWGAAQLVPRRYQPFPPAPAMWLRRAFVVHRRASKARLYVTALGSYEARLNGRRVGDALLTPEPSYYSKHVLYRVHDVTDMINRGENVLGLTVGDGWYGSFDGNYAFGPPPRRALVQLEMTLDDGTQQIVGTGSGWRIAESMILESQVRVGEIHDARLEQSGWAAPQFDDTSWESAEVDEQPTCVPRAQVSPPIRVVDYIKARTVTEPSPGFYVLDFGQNLSGWCRLRVSGPRGTRVVLEYAELLNSAGLIEQPYLNIGIPKRDVFILKGDSSGESFAPLFAYRGFRYVQVRGLPTPPTSDTLVAVAIHTDLRVTGKIRSSNALVYDIWQATARTHRCNIIGLPTDTPGREQRHYSEVPAIMWDGAAFEADVAALTPRVMDVFVDNQLESGNFPRRILTPLWNNGMEDTRGTTPGHGEAGIILPYVVWQRYGDTSIIEKYWTAMNRHVQFILNHNPDFLWRNQLGHDQGDWFALDVTDPKAGLPHTPHDLVATAFWAYAVGLLSEMADAISRPVEAKQLRETRAKIKQAFGSAFVKSDGQVGNGTQSSYILALRFDLLADDLRSVAAARLAENIRSRGVALTTGMFGTQFVWDALVSAGMPELAYELFLRTDYPSWGHMIRNGATTIWETWSGWVRVPEKKMCTNHPDLASASGFLFRHFAGIDASSPGFQAIRICPVLSEHIASGGGDFDSTMGRITTDWSREADGRLRLSVAIPANASARVHLPSRRTDRIMESRRDLARHRDVKLVERLDNEAVVDIGSGLYHFTVEPNAA